MNTAEWIADQEGFSETAYRDSAGYWTIGFGRVLTRDINAPMPTERTTRQRELTDHFIPEVEERKTRVRRIMGVKLHDDELTALTSFEYNLGAGSLKRLRPYVMDALDNSLRQPAVRLASEWCSWCKVTVDGRKQAVAGLLARRRREVALFFGVEL